MKSIAILGSSGSIGTSTLEVARHLSDSIQVSALAVHSNIDVLETQIQEFRPEVAAVYDPVKAAELRMRNPGIEILEGEEGICAVAALPGVDLAVIAIVGMVALAPTLSAIEARKKLALANKEVLVSAGELITRLAQEKGVPLIPIDSEHSAIFQCLQGMDPGEIGRVILTASGGPFRTLPLPELAHVSLEQALNHPKWQMGPKVTIDSSTLMNKGLEMIEARWLFGLPPEKIDVVIHPQSLVHSFVECIDGSMLAQISEPKMTYPIQYALTYPERKPGMYAPFDFTRHAKLEFYPPDPVKFPSLGLAGEALRVGASYPCYLNAANETLVDRFLDGHFPWLDILRRLETLMERHRTQPTESLEAIYSIDRQARKDASVA